MKTPLAMSNTMACREDFDRALDRFVDWRIHWMDVRDAVVPGKDLLDLTDEDATIGARKMAERGVAVYCLASIAFSPDLALGEAAFREEQLGSVGRVLELARIFKPRVVRLLAPQMKERGALPKWLVPMFQEAVDRIADAGFMTTIENEHHNCIFAKPQDVLEFFAALNRPRTAQLTWDVQNMWGCGTFPTIEVYRQLKPVIGYCHVKGGQHDGTNLNIRWMTSLEHASWPVLEITRQVVADGVSPVICLNGPHGSPKPGCEYSLEADVTFLRREIPELEQ